jgi:phage terminase small subunit
VALDQRRRVFVTEFCRDRNGKRASQAAGYKNDVSNQLLRETEIALAIENDLRRREASIVRDSEAVLDELARVGFSDLRKVFSKDGGLLPVSEWPEDTARAISSVEVEELFEGSGKDREQVGWTKKVKLWPKTEALSLLGKNLKLFTDVIDVRVEAMTNEERAMRAEALITAGLQRRLQQKLYPDPQLPPTVDVTPPDQP